MLKTSYYSRQYSRGFNSQGTLLLAATTIKDMKAQKLSFIQRSISVYNRIVNRNYFDDLDIIKKRCVSESKGSNLKPEISYISASYLDQSKKSKILQLYVTVQSPNGHQPNIFIFEKTILHAIDGNMWRYLGFI